MNKDFQITIKRKSTGLLKNIPASIIIDNQRHDFNHNDERIFKVDGSRESVYLVINKNNVIKFDTEKRETIILNIKEGIFDIQYLICILGGFVSLALLLKELSNYNSESNVFIWLLTFTLVTSFFLLKRLSNNYFYIEEE